MLVYGHFIGEFRNDKNEVVLENKFSLQCSCGIELGLITVAEYEDILKNENNSIVEHYYNTVLCERCQFELLSNLTTLEIVELQELQLKYPTRNFSIIEDLDCALISPIQSLV